MKKRKSKICLSFSCSAEGSTSAGYIYAGSACTDMIDEARALPNGQILVKFA